MARSMRAGVATGMNKLWIRLGTASWERWYSLWVSPGQAVQGIFCSPSARHVVDTEAAMKPSSWGSPWLQFRAASPMLIGQKPIMSWIFTWPSPTPWGTSDSDWGVRSSAGRRDSALRVATAGSTYRPMLNASSRDGFAVLTERLQAGISPK